MVSDRSISKFFARGQQIFDGLAVFLDGHWLVNVGYFGGGMAVGLQVVGSWYQPVINRYLAGLVGIFGCRLVNVKVISQ